MVAEGVIGVVVVVAVLVDYAGSSDHSPRRRLNRWRDKARASHASPHRRCRPEATRPALATQVLASGLARQGVVCLVMQLERTAHAPWARFKRTEAPHTDQALDELFLLAYFEECDF